METGYIKLPPLPADTSVETLELIWQFTKLERNEQEMVRDYLRDMLEGSNTGQSAEKFSKMLADGETAETNPAVTEFAGLMRNMIGELAAEACELAAFVYQQYCMDGKTLAEIAAESEVDENILCLIAQYYDRKNSAE